MVVYMLLTCIGAGQTLQRTTVAAHWLACVKVRHERRYSRNRCEFELFHQQCIVLKRRSLLGSWVGP